MGNPDKGTVAEMFEWTSWDHIISKDEALKKLESADTRTFLYQANKWLKDYLNYNPEDKQEFTELCTSILTGDDFKTALNGDSENNVDFHEKLIKTNDWKEALKKEAFTPEERAYIAVASLYLWLKDQTTWSDSYENVRAFLLNEDNAPQKLREIKPLEAEVDASVKLGNVEGVVAFDQAKTDPEEIDDNVSVTYELAEWLNRWGDITVSPIIEVVDYNTIWYTIKSNTNNNFSHEIDMNDAGPTTLGEKLTIEENSYTISYNITTNTENKKTINIQATKVQFEVIDEGETPKFNQFTDINDVVSQTKDYFTPNWPDLDTPDKEFTEWNTLYKIYEHEGIRFATIEGDAKDTYAGTVVEIEWKKTPVINKTKADDLHKDLETITSWFTKEQTYNLILANECTNLFTSSELQSDIASLLVDETYTLLKYRLGHALQQFDKSDTNTGWYPELYNKYVEAYNSLEDVDDITAKTNVDWAKWLINALNDEKLEQVKEYFIDTNTQAPQFRVEESNTPVTIASENTWLPAWAQATVKEDGTTISIGDKNRTQQADGTYPKQEVEIDSTTYEITPVVDQETRTATFTVEKLLIENPQEFEQKNEEAMGQIAELGKTMLSMGKLFENPVFQEHMKETTDNIVDAMQRANADIENKYDPHQLDEARNDLTSLISVEEGQVQIHIDCLLNDNGTLNTSGKIIYESLQQACSILHKHIAEFHKNLLADKDKIVSVNADTYTKQWFDILTDMLWSMTQTLGQVNNYLWSEASFISVLNYIKDDPTRIASLFDTEKQKIDSPAERFALYSPVMTLWENSKSMIDTYSLPNALANETDVTQIAGHLEEFFKNTTPITFNKEIVYFNTDQLLDQWFATRNENGTVEITPNKDQLLLDAWENQGAITGFSVSSLVRTLYNNPHCVVRSENDMRDETDAEQNTWLQSLTTTETSFTKDESKKLGNIYDLDNAIEEQVRQPRKQQALRIKVENQTPIIITHGLIGSTIEEPESKIYKVQLWNNPENLYYFSAKNFNKFMENYDDNYTRQWSNDEQTLASAKHKAEQKNLTIDQIKLVGQKYGIDINNFTNAWGTITPIAWTQKLLFTQKGGNTVQLDMQWEKISFNLPGKETDKTISIPFEENNINKYFDNACTFTSQYNTLYNYRLENQDKWPKQKDPNQTQRTNQLVSLETYATELVTWQINATSLEADDSGFDTEISFNSWNVTINQFTYQDDTNLLKYKPTASS